MDINFIRSENYSYAKGISFFATDSANYKG